MDGHEDHGRSRPESRVQDGDFMDETPDEDTPDSACSDLERRRESEEPSRRWRDTSLVAEDEIPDGIIAREPGIQIATLKKFNAATWRYDATNLMLGKRRRGKNKLLFSLCYHNKERIPYVYVFSPTERVNKSFCRKIPPEFISFDLLPSKLQELFARQRMLRTDPPPDFKAKGLDPNILIILDDCMAGGAKELNSKEMNELFSNGRHDKAGCTVLIQYIKQLPKKLRQNGELIWLLREDNQDVLADIYTEYFSSVFSSKEEFFAYADFYSRDYKCLVLDTTIASAKNEIDRLFWYKADATLEDAEWRMGERTLWPFHERYYVEPQNAKFDYSTGALPPMGPPPEAAKSTGKRGKKGAATEVRRVFRCADENGHVLPDAPGGTGS